MMISLLRGKLFKSLQVAVMVLTAINVSAQSGKSYWQSTATVNNKDAVITENKRNLTLFKLYELDMSSLKIALANAPQWGASDAKGNLVYFPDADGSLLSFNVYETYNMEAPLAAAFPEIKSYIGKGIEDPTALIYFSVSPLGLQTMLIRADKQAVFIEPYTNDLSTYAVYRKGDKTKSQDTFECRIIDRVSEIISGGGNANRPNADDGNFRTYRLALSVTGEYTAFFGGTKALALAAMNNTMTRVNGVCEIDCGLHMNIIANDTLVIYTNASTDPYSPASSGAQGAWNSQLQSTLTSVIGNAGYDIGHLFGATGGGGNAGCIGCVCVAGQKGSGFTSPADGNPFGDNFDIDYVIHEMGHQFGANHTFTFQTEMGSIAQMEPGSGSTIMGYAGITGSTDVQPHSDAYFHAISIQQITNYIKGTTCQTTTATGNAIPTADAGLDYSIPKGTPFALTGVGTDANDVGLTYCWEEMNTGTSSTTLPSVSASSGPAFRSFIQSSSPTRYFPRLATIQAGATSWTWEAVPSPATNARTLNFRFTVRDNHAGGPANNSDDMVVTVSPALGPFVVTAPNTAITWAGGSTQTVTWNVASTTAAPVNCANVKISLSTDGGNTFPTVISANTPNDGTESITVPNVATAQARIKVEAVGNIFFDMSNANFTITAGSALNTITTSAISPLSYCAGASVNVPFTINAAANAGNVFTAQLSDSTGSFASPVSIGTLSSTAAGTIAATIPSGTLTGVRYRIRVVSSNPVVTGADNGANITVNAKPVPSISGTLLFCQGSASQLCAPAGLASYSWGTGASTQCITVNTANTFTVSVTNANGCSGSTSATTAVNPNPTPSISGTLSFCQGSATQLCAPAGLASYSWSTGATTQCITVNTANTFTVTVTNANGCSGSTSATTIVNANPSPSISGNIQFCANSSINLDAGSGFVSYIWSTGATTQTINVTGPNATYTVTVTNANGCSGSTSVTTLVYFTPAVTITGNTSFCAGSSINLSSGFTGLNNWSTGATSESIGVSTTGTFTVTVTDANGCTGSASATTTVNPLPNVSFSGLAASYNVNAAAATLTGSPVGGTFSGPGISGNTFTPSVAGVGGPYNITYSYTDVNTCSNSSTQQTTVTNCAPPARPGTITTTGGAAKVCPGTTKTYSVANVTGATSYTWTTPSGGNITNGQGTRIVTINYTIGFTANDSLRVVANNSCGSSVSRALLISRNVPGTPGAITGSAYSVCNLSGVPYSVTNVAGLTYNWSFNVASATIASGAGTNAVTADFSPSFTSSGIVSVSATNACGTGALRSLTVRATPSTPVSISGSTTACANQAGVPYSTAAIASATNYTWSVPSGARINDGSVTSTTTTLVTTATSVTVNFAATAGTVRVRANNACGVGTYRSLTVSFVCRDGEQTLAEDLNLTCYPMPASDQLNVSFFSTKEQTNTIRIFDLVGKILLNQSNNSVIGENKFIIDVSTIASGIYMLEVGNGNQKSLQKVVIE